MANPRRANGARRNALRKRIAAQGLPCAVCGQAIDYDLPAGHEMAYELDEIVPIRKGGDPLDPRNVQPVHRICNRLKYQAEARAERSGGKVQPIVKAARSW